MKTHTATKKELKWHDRDEIRIFSLLIRVNSKRIRVLFLFVCYHLKDKESAIKQPKACLTTETVQGLQVKTLKGKERKLDRCYIIIIQYE